jgi:hypothetical protein
MKCPRCSSELKYRVLNNLVEIDPNLNLNNIPRYVDECYERLAKKYIINSNDVLLVCTNCTYCKSGGINE